mgnify:FL=1
MKSKETYEKVAETFKKKADKAWAKGKNDEGGHNFEVARKFYGTVDKAKKKI